MALGSAATMSICRDGHRIPSVESPTTARAATQTREKDLNGRAQQSREVKTQMAST